MPTASGSCAASAGALIDPTIGLLFTDVAKLDLEAHVPRITAFWEAILLGAQSDGGAFAPHVRLHLTSLLRGVYFEPWLVLWDQTVDELVRGPVASWPRGTAITSQRPSIGVPDEPAALSGPIRLRVTRR